MSSTPHDQTHTAPSRVSMATVVLYGLPAVAIQFIYMLIMVMYMNFATDVLLVAPATVGAIFFASKLWDAVSDPLVGFLSDRTRLAFGRRRSWMLASSIPVSLFCVMPWVPPMGMSELETSVWIGIAIFGFYTAYSSFYVPHLALGAELSSDARERTRIYGSRQIGSSIGLLGAFALGAPLLEQVDTARITAAELGWGAAAACLVSIIVATLLLPREPASSAGRGGRNLMTAMRDVWKNPHARLLLFVFFIESLGVGGTSVMAPYIVKYVIKLEGVLGLVLMAFVVPTALSIPVWIWLAGRFERHKLWIAGMALSCVGYGSLVFVDEGRLGVMLFCSVASGIGSGCGSSLGQAIKADVIDYDEYLTHERKEGAYFAVWAFMGKLASGLMVGLAGVALSVAGYVENTEQTPLVRTTIIALNGGVPFVCFLIGIAAFTRFRLDSREHARILSAIQTRSSLAQRTD
ncbi:MFS transporter [Myxococcota bacterium]|nr:MFS transporter [Myxococcota bacterium]